MKTSNSTFIDFLASLSTARVRYRILRDVDKLDQDLGDLDLLVWPQDREAFRRVAAEQGFKRQPTRMPGKDVHARVSDCKLVYLDVHHGLIQRGLEYQSLASIEDRVLVTPQGYHALTHEDQLLHLFFHNLVGKQHLQEKHLPLVEELLRRPLDRDYLNARLEREGERRWFDRFCDDPTLFARDPEVAGRAAREVTRSLRGASLANAWRSFKLRHAGRWSRSRRGLHVAFVGVDGSGKSTTLECVRAILEESPKLRSREVYMGPWGKVRSPFLRVIYRLKLFPPIEDWSEVLRRKLRGEESRGLFHILRKLIFGKAKGIAYYLAVYCEFWYRFIREVRPALRKRSIVLSDRYICDLRHIYKKRRMRNYPLLRAFICRFFPRPDLVVFLHNDPATIAGRKDQLREEEIEEMQACYRDALERYTVLDCVTDRPPEELSRSIVQELLSRYLEVVR